MIVGQFHGRECRGIDDGERVLDFAMDELRAKLDGNREIRLVEGEDAAADALAALDDADTPAGTRKVARGSKARRAGADDQNVVADFYSLTISAHGSLRTARTFSSMSFCVARSPRTRRR